MSCSTASWKLEKRWYADIFLNFVVPESSRLLTRLCRHELAAPALFAETRLCTQEPVVPALLDEQLAIVKSASGARREGGGKSFAQGPLFFGPRVEDRQTKIRDRQTDR